MKSPSVKAATNLICSNRMSTWHNRKWIGSWTESSFLRKTTAFLTWMTEIKYISIMISKSRFRRVESRGRQVIITLGSWRFLALIGQSHLFTIFKLFRRIVFFYFGLIKNFLKFSGSKIFQFFVIYKNGHFERPCR